MISDEKQRTQWGCRSCVIVREVWRRGGGGRWWASLHITQRGVRTEIVSHIYVAYIWTTYIGIEEMNN